MKKENITQTFSNKQKLKGVPYTKDTMLASFNKEAQLSGTQTGQYSNATPSKISISVFA